MRNVLALLVIVFGLGATVGSARADVPVDMFRCEHGVVEIGSSRGEVTRACGAPSDRLQRRQLSLGTPLPYIAKVSIHQHAVIGTVEDWVYDDGASVGSRETLTFVGDRLAEIVLVRQ